MLQILSILAGIYIHIPFCKTRCSYCDFFSSTDYSTASRYVNAICRELEVRKSDLPNETIQTIYFGGGTPSQLSIEQFERIFRVIQSNYSIESNAEITIDRKSTRLNSSH